MPGSATMDFIKDFNIIAEDVVYNQAKPQTDLEARIYDVLSHKNWSPSSTMLDELAQDTYDYEKYPIIMKSLWDGMNNHPAAWRIVFKSLILLEHLIKHGNERCVDEAQGNKHFLRGLLHFNNFEGTVDRGINVREKSKQIAELLSDNERILEERQKAKRLRENLAVLSQGSGGSFISSMMNSSSSSYTGYLKNEYTGPTYSGYVKDVRYSDRNSSTNTSTVLNVSNSFEDPSSKTSKLINQQAKVIKNNTNKKKKKESSETSAAAGATSSDLTSLSDDMMFSSFDDGSIAAPAICTPVPASVENNRNNATLPQRIGEPDCRDYLRTGRCKYGETCKYHHPPNVQSGGGIASIDPSEPPFPIRPGEPACQYFLKHGTCKFGQTCKFNHPPNFKARLPEQHHLSPQQQHSMPHQGRLPQRPGEPDCIYFLRNGRCKYGFTCKYHHPLRNMRRSASLGSDPRTANNAAGNTQYILLDPSNLVMINKDGSHTKFTTTAAAAQAQAQVQLQGHHPQQGFFPHTTSSPVLVSTSALNGASPLLTSTTSLASSYDASTLSTLGGGNVSTTPGGGGESYPSWQQQQRRSRINSVSSALSMEEYLQRGPPPPLTSVYHQQTQTQTQHHSQQQQQTQNNSESGSSSVRESLSGSSLKDLSAAGGGQVPPPSSATSEKYDEGLSEMTSALLNILDHDDEGEGEKGKMVNNLNSSSPTSNNNNTDNTNNNSQQQQQQQQGLLRQNLDPMNIMMNDSNSNDILLSAGSNSYIGPRSLPSTLSNIGSYQKAAAGTGGSGILMNDPPMLPPKYSPSSYSYHHGNFLSKNTTNTATGISVGGGVSGSVGGGVGGIGDLIQQQHSQHAPQKMHQRSLLSSVMEEQQQQQQQQQHSHNTTTNTAATAAAQNWSPSSWQPSSSLPNTFFPRL